MKTQLLCTFTNTKGLSKSVDKIIEAYDILYNKLFVLRNESDTRELMCTYNIDSSGDVAILPDTISLHRKKQTNTLYTINALNECIKTCNNGVLDTSFQLEWDNYRNSILLTNDTGLRRIDTSVHEVIYIKVKR
jgi:hypothetical protein|tara:strand:- start:674 stop:1075 length:402 start_codon:yes stop_codon:yes gene_type:complete